MNFPEYSPLYLRQCLDQYPACLATVKVIISGGQTGADRAALEFAKAFSIPYGGWCPKGRKAEDGAIPSSYTLAETQSASYIQRTKFNIRDSDATLIFNTGELTDGTATTLKNAQLSEKPALVLALDHAPFEQQAETLALWLQKHQPQLLNIAGPRESKRVGIHQSVYTFLSAMGVLPA